MKKTFNKLSLILAAIMLFAISSAQSVKAQDCKGAINTICSFFDNATKKIQRVNNLDTILNMNFEEVFDADFDDVDADCMSYRLTVADKLNLTKSFGRLIDSFSERIYVLTDHALPLSEINAQFDSIRNPFNKLVENVDTLSDLIEGFNKIGY